MAKYAKLNSKDGLPTIVDVATKAITDFKGRNLGDHIDNISNPHKVTKTQVGLGNVDNTSDADKPISDATQRAITELSGNVQAELVKKQDIANMVESLEGDIVNKYPSATLLKEAIQTATANFLGEFATWEDVPEVASGFRIPPTKNDEIVITSDTSHGHTGQTYKYKYLLDTTKNEYDKNDWIPEYKVNDTPFSQRQWDSINSGITAELVALISTLQTEVNNIKAKMLTARDPTSK